MPFIEQLGQQMLGQAATGATGGVLGMIFGKQQDRRQRKQAQKLQDMQIRGQKEMTDYNYNKQMQMWRDTNYSAQMDQLEAAGLNPGLIYGMGGGGGATTAVNAGSVGGQAAAAEVTGGAQGMGIITGAQLRLLEAQRENVEADTRNKDADTANKPKQGKQLDVQTDLLKIDLKFYQQTFDARINELDRRIENITQNSREIDQRIGITADTRQAVVDKAQQEAIGAMLTNIAIGENTKATTQQIEESKARVNQMAEQIKNWQEQIKQGWEGLSLKEKEIKLNALMQEVDAVTRQKGIAELPALTPNQRRQVIRQIDKIARIGEGDAQ